MEFNVNNATRFDQESYTPEEQLLKGKVIAVTGAGSGIGRDAALSYAAHGATVILLGRTTEKLEQVYDEIENAGHPQAAIYPINFEGAVEKDYADMCNSLDEAFGHLDGILHNASELGERTPISNYSADVWQRVLQVNVSAPFMMTKALTPLLTRSESASVVFTGSSVGYEGRAYWGAYAVSKAATENLMQVLADEFDEVTQIRCNSINPGATRTRMRAAAYPAENPADVKEAASIMPLYLYLMGKDSLETNGQQFLA
jgi:NAD(P)-dependent dehydrogenase (short-subunit alcohol dehydrogenase family)